MHNIIYPCQIFNISATIPFKLLMFIRFHFYVHTTEKPSYFPQIFSGLSNKLIMPLHTNRSWKHIQMTRCWTWVGDLNIILSWYCIIIVNICNTENQRWNFEFIYVGPSVEFTPSFKVNFHMYQFSKMCCIMLVISINA